MQALVSDPSHVVPVSLFEIAERCPVSALCNTIACNWLNPATEAVSKREYNTIGIIAHFVNVCVPQANSITVDDTENSLLITEKKDFNRFTPIIIGRLMALDLEWFNLRLLMDAHACRGFAMVNLRECGRCKQWESTCCYHWHIWRDDYDYVLVFMLEMAMIWHDVAVQSPVPCLQSCVNSTEGRDFPIFGAVLVMLTRRQGPNYYF